MKDSGAGAATLLPEEGEVIAEGLKQALADVTADPGVDSVNPPNDFWLHKFRETFATMHLRVGVDPGTVRLWLGHRDLESTMRYVKPARGRAFGKR